MEDCYDSDGELDPKQHAKLVENVLSLNRRPQFKKPTRTEPTLKVSEFNLVKSITGKQGIIHVNDLTKALKKRAKHVEISKKLRSTERKSKILPKPMEKPQAQRIKRNLAYQNVKKKLDRWDAIVTKNRGAHHLPFPIPSKLKLYTTGETTNEFESRMNAENKEYPLTMEEIFERRQEISKMRAVQSYNEAKARRQSKIKSKKYHRIQRKEKIKNQIKEFEQLQKTNPEEALKKLDEIERARAEERANLRHRSTGKWAKSKQVRAKYDKDSRQVLAQQLSISRDLTQKLQNNKDSDSEEEKSAAANAAIPINTNNPWTNPNPNQGTNEVIEFVENYRKFWDKASYPVIEANPTNGNTNSTKKIKEGILNRNNPVLEVQQIEQIISRPNDLNKKLKNHKKIKPEVSKQVRETNVKNVSKKNKQRTEYLGTTEWNVGNLSDDSEPDNTIIDSIDMDIMFDNFQKKLKKQLGEKYNSLKTSIGNSNIQQSNKRNQQNSKKKQTQIKSKAAVPIKDTRLFIDECFTENNENDNQELEVLKSILNNDEKTIDDPCNAPIKTMAVNLNTDIPDLFSLEDNEENTDQKGTISEAFQDDDIVEEFKNEKQAEINSDKIDDIDLSLPGWGSWGGIGIKPSKRKNKRFIIKFPKEFKRRDDNKQDVFINEKGNNNIKKHKVSEVPFPFRHVKDFEASIRAPIGETFVPELAFKKMIKPSVTTKMGAIIEPMTEDILID